MGYDPAAGYTLATPSHPAGFVRELLAELDLSVTAAAAALGVTRPTLSQLLNERVSLSSDMALRLEKAFGVRLDTLMRMQNAYDIAQVRSRAGEIDVPRYVPKRKSEPQPSLL